MMVSLFLLPVLLIGCNTEPQETRPNIVLIMVDDMGYSDIGCYGGEIPTPHIDRLAEGGVRFTQFYNGARCCPTRASLLTGLFPHQTGVGQMTNSPRGENFHWGTPGYQGYLNDRCVTMAEVLGESGYRTYMTGKWHLGYHSKDRYPLARGFEKFYGIIPGACSYFRPHGNRPLTYMNRHLDPPGEGYYTTDAFTDSAISFIAGQPGGEPFFLYLSYNAPHWPLHAKEEDIERFRGTYMEGWDRLRDERLRRQTEMGLFPESMKYSPRDERVRPWSEVDSAQKVRSDYRMAVYAAQVFSVDQNVGKLLRFLENEDLMENTLILFLSDNGGCAEMYDEFGSRPDSLINDPGYGGAVSYGIGWANLSNTPFYEYKVQTYEGGISTPLILHWPAGFSGEAKGSITHVPAYLIDLMPTLLQVSGADYPAGSPQGAEVHPLEGSSLVPVARGSREPLHEYMYWEHQSNCAVRKGRWKAVKRLNEKEWKLFNLESDRAEQVDLAGEFPEVVGDLSARWNRWAEEKYVVPKRPS